MAKRSRHHTISIDIWFYRIRSTAAEPAADLHGRPLEVDWITRGGRRMGLAADHRSSLPPTPSLLPELLRRQAATIARYRLEGRCTDAELRTIVALWSDGKTLRQHAREEGCTAQAIESRINGLHTKAPEFFRWWRLKNLSRRLRRRRW